MTKKLGQQQRGSRLSFFRWKKSACFLLFSRSL